MQVWKVTYYTTTNKDLAFVTFFADDFHAASKVVFTAVEISTGIHDFTIEKLERFRA